MNRAFKGVWIPVEIWDCDAISWMEKCLLAEINALDAGEGCWASNEFLAEKFSTTAGNIAKILSSLRSLGFIETVKFDGRTRWLKVNAGLTNREEQGLQNGQPCTYESGNAEASTNIQEKQPEFPTKRGKGLSRQKDQSDLEKIYALYPKKVAKAKALEAIAKALKDKPFDFLEQAVREYADAVRRNIESGAWEDMSFVPHPSTWFNGAQYEDDRSTWLKKTVAKKRTAFEVNLLIKNTQEAIDTHPANPESISGVDRPTEEQKAALRELKTRLFNLREELNKIA